MYCSHILEPLCDSEQAAAHAKAHKKTLQRYARDGLVVGLRVGKLWRFRLSGISAKPGRRPVSKQGSVCSAAKNANSR